MSLIIQLLGSDIFSNDRPFFLNNHCGFPYFDVAKGFFIHVLTKIFIRTETFLKPHVYYYCLLILFAKKIKSGIQISFLYFNRFIMLELSQFLNLTLCRSCCFCLWHFVIFVFYSFEILIFDSFYLKMYIFVFRILNPILSFSFLYSPLNVWASFSILTGVFDYSKIQCCLYLRI